jgi:hypothetical protein
MLEEGRERMNVGGVEVPLGAGTKEHAGRHVKAPERITDDDRLDAAGGRAGGHRKTVGARADDESGVCSG